MNVLLHTCCAPCTTHCIEVLRKLEHEPTLFYSNANIYPPEEHEKRLQEVVKLAEICDVPLLIDNTDHNDWIEKAAKGFEQEPEKGARCERCFGFSLQRTYNRMIEEGLDAFTTTLTVSPHKISQIIASVGKGISEECYLDINFKKQDGFKRSLELSDEYKLYRQSYCGCEFSMRDRKLQA